jgi:hypothetical protein
LAESFCLLYLHALIAGLGHFNQFSDIFPGERCTLESRSS